MHTSCVNSPDSSCSLPASTQQVTPDYDINDCTWVKVGEENECRIQVLSCWKHHFRMSIFNTFSLGFETHTCSESVFHFATWEAPVWDVRQNMAGLKFFILLLDLDQLEYFQVNDYYFITLLPLCNTEASFPNCCEILNETNTLDSHQSV